jgi:HopA1 effector protein family
MTAMISSRESFEAFVGAAWSFFGIPKVDELSGAFNLNDLYVFASNYNPANVPPKDPLSHTDLDAAMATLVQATIPYQIVMQGHGWPELTGEAQALVAYYNARAAQQRHAPPKFAELLKTTYLHVYPTAPAEGNWRIGFNVRPVDIAAAMAELAPIMNQYDSLDHMKFLCPGSASKADSVIVYADRQVASFDALKHAALQAMRPFRLQPRVGAIWEEIHPGVGEAAEPPQEADGTSFTAYRCILAYIAHWKYSRQAQRPNFDEFRHYLGEVFEIFGIDPQAPFLQGPLRSGNDDFVNWWDAYDTVQAAWTTDPGL